MSTDIQPRYDTPEAGESGRMSLTSAMLEGENRDPLWRRARITARILIKAKFGGRLSRRDRRLARLLGNDENVSNELFQKAVRFIEVDFISRRWAAGRTVEPEPEWLRQR